MLHDRFQLLRLFGGQQNKAARTGSKPWLIEVVKMYLFSTPYIVFRPPKPGEVSGFPFSSPFPKRAVKGPPITNAEDATWVGWGLLLGRHSSRGGIGPVIPTP